MTLEEFKFIFWMEYGHRCVVPACVMCVMCLVCWMHRFVVPACVMRVACWMHTALFVRCFCHLFDCICSWIRVPRMPAVKLVRVRASHLRLPPCCHRMWGRALGLAFVLPGSYFLARGYIRGALGKRLALLGLMGGAQGLVGWWMVRSGLKEPEGQQQVGGA